MNQFDLDHDTPLNKAHRYARQAEDNEKSYKFDSALKCHNQAINYFREALIKCTNDKAKESLSAQIAFHERQTKLVEQRKEYFARKAEDYYRRKNEAILKKQPNSKINAEGLNDEVTRLKENNQIYLESEIYRVIEEHDSLLQFLVQRNEDGDNVTSKSSSSFSSSKTYTSGAKVPKNDSTVIEELKMNNDQLRQLVHQLVGELEKLQDENHHLRIELISSKAEETAPYPCLLPELHPLEPPKLLY